MILLFSFWTMAFVCQRKASSGNILRSFNITRKTQKSELGAEKNPHRSVSPSFPNPPRGEVAALAEGGACLRIVTNLWSPLLMGSDFSPCFKAFTSRRAASPPSLTSVPRTRGFVLHHTMLRLFYLQPLANTVRESVGISVPAPPRDRRWVGSAAQVVEPRAFQPGFTPFLGAPQAPSGTGCLPCWCDSAVDAIVKP